MAIQPRPTAQAINAFPAIIRGYKPITADGAVIPLVYGRDSVNGFIFAQGVLSTTLYVGVAWCLGEIFAVEKVYINGETAPSGVEMRHYKGTITQGIDSWLAAAVAGYTDTLVLELFSGATGIAYTVFKIPTSTITGVPRFQGVINGKLVIDPQATAQTDPFYDDNAIDVDFESGGVDQSQYGHTVTLIDQGFIDSAGLNVNSLNTEPIVDDGGPLIWTKAGNATLSSVVSESGGTSLIITADGDALYSGGAAFAAASDVGFECYIYANSFPGTIGGASKAYIFSVHNLTGGDEFELYVKGHKLAVAYDGVESVGTTTIDVTALKHVELCIKGTAVYVYYHGALEITATWTGHTIQQGRICLGALDDGSFTSAIDGYFDEVRIEGFARHFDGYMVPVGASPDSKTVGDDYFELVQSLLHFEGINGATTTSDETGRSWTFYSAAAISTTQAKWGASSLACLTADDIIRTPMSLTAGDIFEINDATTLECWIYVTDLSAKRGIFGTKENPVTNNNGIECYVNTSGAIGFDGWDNTASAVISLTGTAGDIVVDEWHHIVIQRDVTGNWAAFVGQSGADGIIAAGPTAESGNVTAGSTDFVLGAERYDVSGAHLNGYIEDFRATAAGARYGQEYTPPAGHLNATT